MEESRVFFRPEIYEVETLEQAKAITVTAEEGTDTEERWQRETAYLAEEIGRRFEPRPDDYILDYGCGTGRVARALIERYGCRVIGVDASRSMRLLSIDYVLSERFCVWSPETLARMTGKGFRFTGAICLWVLQHVLSPEETIGLIRGALPPEGWLYVLNQDTRCVPTNLGYVDDGRDVGSLLRASFEVRGCFPLPAEVTTPRLSECSSIFVLDKSARTD